MTALLRFALPPSLGLEQLVDETRALREALQDLLATPVDVTVSQSYEALARNILSGAVDAAHAPPYVCAVAESQGAVVAARAVRHGRATYGAALVKKKGSATSLNTPKPIRAAWVDPHSVAGYLLPLAHLRDTRRIEPARHFASQAFFGSYPAALAAVLDGRADIASVHALKGKPEAARDAIERSAKGRASELDVMETTSEVPGDGILAGKPDTARALRDAFVALVDEPFGKHLLDAVFAAERFEPAPPRGYRALYAVAPKES